MFKKNPKIIYRIIDNETFIVTPDNKTHQLDEISTFFFKLIDSKNNEEEIISKGSEYFEEDIAIIRKDFNELKEELIKKDILINN